MIDRIKISANFFLDEFIDQITYSIYGASSKWFIDKRTVELAQFFRTRYGKPMLINNWATGGPFTERGYRRPESTTGGKVSQHKRGHAFDSNTKDMTADEVRVDILANPKIFMDAGLTTIEHGDASPTWCHGDTRWTGMDKILIVRPAEAVINLENYAPEQDEYFTSENGQLVPINFQVYED